MATRTKSRSGSRSSSTGSRSGRGRGSSARTSNMGRITTDHREIRRWVEERGGSPACVKGTGGGGDEGVLRIDFPGYSGQESLRHIPWDEWFVKFDSAHLALLYQDRTAGGTRSNFNKLVDRSEMKQQRGQGRASSNRRGKSRDGRHGRRGPG